MRKFVGAVAILAISFGIAMAEELKGKITKIDGSKITFQEKKGKEYGDPKDYDAKDAKVSKMDKKDKVAVAGGLSADELKNIDAKKGKQATINVEGGKVTEIILTGGKKKDAK
jgi:hypothetical protein